VNLKFTGKVEQNLVSKFDNFLKMSQQMEASQKSTSKKISVNPAKIDVKDLAQFMVRKYSKIHDKSLIPRKEIKENKRNFAEWKKKRSQRKKKKKKGKVDSFKKSPVTRKIKL